MSLSLAMSAELFDGLHAHLVRPHEKRPVEQVAFLFTEPYAADGTMRLQSMHPVPAEDFVVQTDYHVDLAEHVRPDMIKRAWDSGGSLIEAHSHVQYGEVGFSRSDLAGFDDWVPHVWWRLKRRPYAALVFGYDSFDGLCWAEDPQRAERLVYLQVDGRKTLSPTNRTIDRLTSRQRRNADD